MGIFFIIFFLNSEIKRYIFIYLGPEKCVKFYFCIKLFGIK